MMIELDEKTPFGVIKVKSSVCIALLMISDFERRRKEVEGLDQIYALMLNKAHKSSGA